MFLYNLYSLSVSVAYIFYAAKIKPFAKCRKFFT